MPEIVKEGTQVAIPALTKQDGVPLIINCGPNISSKAMFVALELVLLLVMSIIQLKAVLTPTEVD